MIELSDWVWLGVLALWVLLRILPRLFRSRAGQEPKSKPAPRAVPESGGFAGPTEIGQEQVADIGPRPIEPK